MAWICALTRPNQEAIAEVNLTRQGYPNYCPKFQTKQVNKPTTIKVLFPRYIFICIDQFWSSILGTRGISRVLLGDNGPSTLPESVIKGLRQRELNGFVQLTAPPRFQPGDPVKCDTGPLTGYPLVYEGMSSQDRVKVLADLLGRKVSIELPEKSLIAA